jgi:DNA repair photolyase
MRIEEIEAKSIIVPSKLPDADYVANPYTGCQFGCLYCYATFTGRFVNESRDNWGNYVYVKKNAIDLAYEQLQDWPDDERNASILLSSVTDAYHGVEKKYQLTRGILGAIRDSQYPGLVSILTKSPMVLRDLDLLEQINAEVGLTITTTDDGLSRFLEVAAPSATRRLETLKKLNDYGIPTYAFVGPLLPHFRYRPDLLDVLFREIASTGTRQVYIEHINLPTYIKERMWRELRRESEETQAAYDGAQTQAHRETLTKMVNSLIEKYGLHIRLGGAIYHGDLKQARDEKKKVQLAGDIHELVRKALSKRGVIRIVYQDFHGNFTERDIAPFEWTDFDERKVRAYCYLRQDDRTFSIWNIRKAEYLGLVDDYREVEKTQ